MGLCAVVSFRLGLSDGVSIVAETWQRALRAGGWETMTVAGEGPVDHLIEELAIGAFGGPNPGRDGGEIPAGLYDRSARPEVHSTTLVEEVAAKLESVLAEADVVLVENLLSIPLNPIASRALANVLAGRAAVLHHHDPPWQRTRFAHVTELPPNDPLWHHVTINRMTQREFEERGFTATTIYNGFDADPAPGDRTATRDALGLGPEDILAAHPVRAIARKNIPKAIELAEELGAVYWLPNPAEEGYDDELERVLATARCRVLRTPIEGSGLTIADLYAAADLVLFPSLWEGFGNPPIEAALHRRPVVVGNYPVADELRSLGFQWFDPNDTDTIQKALTKVPIEMLDDNQRIAREHLSVARMSSEVNRLFDRTGGRT